MNDLLKICNRTKQSFKNKEISVVELTQAAFDRINSVEDKLGAFNSLTKDTAMETAKKLMKKSATKGEELPLLAGIPLALKDNMNLIGSKQPHHLRFWKTFVSPYNATVTEKIIRKSCSNRW